MACAVPCRKTSNKEIPRNWAPSLGQSSAQVIVEVSRFPLRNDFFRPWLREFYHGRQMALTETD